MRSLYLLCFGLFFSFISNAKIVTFSVNMSGQTKSPLGIHVMGDFQALAGCGPDWTPNGCLMIQDAGDTNLYHLTVNIPAFQKYEYKFVNGDQSYEAEFVPVESRVDGNNDNRWIYIDSLSSDTLKLAELPFGGNAPAGLTLLRFLVDMTTTTVSPQGVHVAGGFQSNNPATHQLYSFANQVYELIVYLPIGNYTYKFYNGNTLATSEIVPAICATGGEREVSLSSDLVLNNVCFAQCSTCYPASVQQTQDNALTSVLYPNPAQNKFQVQFLDQSLAHTLQLVNVWGQVVWQTQTRDSQFLVVTQNWPKGIYTLQIMNQEGTQHAHRLILE